MGLRSDNGAERFALRPGGYGQWPGSRSGGFGDVAGSCDIEHSLERHQGPLACLGIDRDLIDDVSGEEVFEGPAEVGQVDAEHGGAEALASAEDGDCLFGMFVSEAVDHVDLGADRPLGSRRRGIDGIADEGGASGEVGFLHDFPFAFGVDDDLDVRGISSDFVDVFGAE